MSTEVGAVLYFSAALVASPFGVVAGAGIAIGQTAKALGSVLFNAGKGVKEVVSLIKEQNEINKNLLKISKSLSLQKNDENALKNYVDKIQKYLNEKDTLMPTSKINKMINDSKTLKEKVSVVDTLLDVQTKFKPLAENFYNLNKLSEENGIDISSIIENYHNLRNENYTIEEYINLISKLNKEIVTKINEINIMMEEKLSNKVFKEKYVEIKKEDENIIPLLFNDELIKLTKNNNTDKELDTLIANKKKIDMLIESYNIIETVSKFDSYPEYSEKLFKLYQDCVNLSKKDLNLKDLEFQIGLKIDSLRNIAKKIDQKDGEVYEAKSNYLYALSINNSFRKELNMSLLDDKFNMNTYEEDIKAINLESEALKERYYKEASTKRIIAELKQQYKDKNYQVVDYETVEETPVTKIHTVYFITPDKKNVLITRVTEKGDINFHVVGVKINGLSDDKYSTFKAQKAHCEHSKDIIENIAKKINADSYKQVVIEEPNEENVEYYNLDDVLPQYYLNKIKNQKLEQKAQNLKHRTV